MASAAPLQHEIAAIPAQRDGEPVGEGDVGAGQAGDRLRLQEQPRHPTVLGVPVLDAALLDEVAGHLVGDDDLRVEGARSQNAHGVVMRQDQVLDRLVGVLTQPLQPIRAAAGVAKASRHDQEVLALDRADVGVALGREGVHPVGQYLEGLPLGLGVGDGGERLVMRPPCRAT